jgi:hypothetical protein
MSLFLERKPVYSDYANNYDDDYRWRGRRLASVAAVAVGPEEERTAVFRVAVVLCALSATFACLAEPAVAALWRQRLDEAERLEQSGQHVAWGRLLSAVGLVSLAAAMAWAVPCYLGRGLHQEVLHPAATAACLGVAAFLALVLLPLPAGKMSSSTTAKRSAWPAAPLRLVARGLAAGLAGAAWGAGTVFLLWHVAALPGFGLNYELLFAAFLAAEAVAALPVLIYTRTAPSPSEFYPIWR